MSELLFSSGFSCPYLMIQNAAFGFFMIWLRFKGCALPASSILLSVIYLILDALNSKEKAMQHACLFTIYVDVFKHVGQTCKI